MAVVWIAAAWAVSALAHAAGADWVLPPLVLLATASLVRGGRRLLDRLVFAAGVLAGMLCLLGFAGVQWPHLLTNTNVAAAALAVAGLGHAFTGRTPHLPRPTRTDLPPVVGGLVVTAVMAWPFLRSDATGRLALGFIGEDGARHFAAFDAIVRSAGYLYWRPEEVSPDVPLTMLRYPQGWHFTTALLDRFLPGAQSRGGMAAFDHYTIWWVAGFGLFALVMIWAASWVAGPVLRGWRQWLLAAVLVGFVLLGDLPGMLVYGAPAEVHALTLLMLLVAILTRQTVKMRERIILIALLIIAIGLTYTMLLPVAGFAVLAWLPRNWAWIKRHLVFFLVSALLVAVAAPVALLIGFLRDDQLVSVITAGGTVYDVNRVSLVLLGGLVVAAMFSPVARKSRVWRAFPTVPIAVAVPIALLWVYQMVTVGHSTYYFEKALHALQVTVAVGAGAVILLLPKPRRDTVRAGTRHLRRNTHHAVLCLALLLAFAGVFVSSDYRRAMTSRLENPARSWQTGYRQSLYLGVADAVLAADKAYPAKEGTLSVMLGTQWGTTYLLTLYLSAIQQTSGVTGPMVYHANRRDVNVANPEQAGAVLRSLPGRVRLIVVSPDAADFAADYARGRNPADLEVVYLPNTQMGCKDRRDVKRPDAPTCP
jgi:hypothetical protein